MQFAMVWSLVIPFGTLETGRVENEYFVKRSTRESCFKQHQVEEYSIGYVVASRATSVCRAGVTQRRSL